MCDGGSLAWCRFFLFSCTNTSSLFNHWVWNAHDLLYFTQHVFQNCNDCWQCGVQAIVNLISVHVKSNIKNRWCGRQWLHSCALTHTNKSDHARWQVQPVEVNGSSLNSMAWNPLSIWNLWKLVARLHTRDSPLTLFSTSQFLLLAGLLTYWQAATQGLAQCLEDLETCRNPLSNLLALFS